MKWLRMITAGMVRPRSISIPRKRGIIPSADAMFSGSVNSGLAFGSVALKNGSESAVPKMIIATPSDIFQLKRRMVVS